jgi:UDP-N-acetylmuramyl pentapeptide phosphotransferase/UDP-N-acetylglucosamine-1-phosphate transferase
MTRLLVTRAVLLALSAGLGLLLVPGIVRALRVLGFERTNFQGRSIGTGGGILFLLGAAAWVVVRPAHESLEVPCAGVLFGLLGLLDDRWGTSEFKGLRGHLRALRRGRITTGLIKAVGGVAAAACLAVRIEPGTPAIAGTLLIALSANLFNLLDLRPLRCLKAFWLLGLPLLAIGPAVLAQFYGLSIPYAPREARREVMLGDVGANALGAVLGAAAAGVLRHPAQWAFVALLLAFHLWAERFSLSVWIDRHPVLRAWDRCGWGE